MSIPRKKSRGIEVNGTQYRWMLKSGSSGGYPRLIGNTAPVLTLTAQIDDPKPGKVMQATLISKKWRTLDEYEREHGTHKASLTPASVARVIAYARSAGWYPMERGAAFEVPGPLDLIEWGIPDPILG